MCTEAFPGDEDPKEQLGLCIFKLGLGKSAQEGRRVLG